MFYLVGGVVVLAGVLLLGRFFVSVDPRRLAQNLQWAAFAIAFALVLLLASGRPAALLLLPFTLLLLPECRRWVAARRSRGARPRSRGPDPPRFLRLGTDPKTGAAIGTVVSGVFAGSRLDELAEDELIMLLRECRVVDPEAADLVETHLDARHPAWRHDPADAESDPGDAVAMTVEEARAILGVERDAGETEIIEAHRRLLHRFHLDRDSTDYFAIKINRARDVLLRR